MAPEQSDVYATQKTDIFSLGVIMSQIMIDVPPLELLITTYDNGRKKSRREKNLTQTNIDSLQYHLGRHMKERHGSHAQITGVAEVVQSMFEYKPENRPSAREITAYLHNI